jgi:Ca-activated chloride channel family protein
MRMARAAEFVGVTVLTLSVLWTARADARTIDDPGQGILLIATDSSEEPELFPLVDTAVHAHIVGYVAHVSVRQTYNNPFTDAIEAVYVFPLPQNAAVSAMTITVGDRVIKGTIKQREEARDMYEKAKSEGKTAALLDQERPNIFSQSVANIEPGKDVVVELEYDLTLAYDDGWYEFVYPMVVGPRYIPGTPNGEPTVGGGTSPDTDEVPDASKITPPIRKPGKRSGHDIAIDVEIDPGLPIKELESPTHQVDVTAIGDATSTAVELKLKTGKTIPNKDLVVRYRLASDDTGMTVLTHRGKTEGYLSLMFEPPEAPAAADIRPKEIFFVVDASGSMSGSPLNQVKDAMRYAIKNLNPDDTFQIIRFSESSSSLSEHSLTNTKDNRRRALKYVDELAADGGTEMINGVRAALDHADEHHKLRVVCFMTDGYIGNETTVLAEIEKLIDDDTRLFSFGIGSSVNRYLLDRMAEVGRGSVHYMLPAEDPGDQIRAFYDRIRSPVLTNIQVDWKGLDVTDVSPARIPDVFDGQPIRLVARYDKPGTAVVVVRGKTASGDVKYELPVTLPATVDGNESVGRLWARAKIRELMATQYHGPTIETEQAITDLALAHGLVSKYTSFVAIEERVVNEDGTSRTVYVPVEIPEGVSYEATVGEMDERVAATKSVPTQPGGDYRGDDDDDEDMAYDSYGGGEGVMAKAELARRVVPDEGSWRWSAGVAMGGLVTGQGADNDALGVVGLRTLRAMRGQIALGGELAILLPGLTTDAGVANVLVQLSYLGLFDGWLDVLAGVGPAVPFDDNIGLGYLGGLQINLPFGGSLLPGVQVRYDGVSSQGADVGAVSVGVTVSW